MFYSQFILAKKGPLGTIWIAAHLERKLRKTQVAETNIGVSVDSILFPEAPIALRLSGHLLLGVVRIFSRKVNYLFHDCSEALVKIKQAFHSTVVDLPPEAATAPFHTITLPETFDLDELELLPDPENSFSQANGNFVDHHVTTREQITLQDSMEDNVYLGSQFGLDERFADGDAPQMGLDFDEDIFAEKLRSPEPNPASFALEEDVLPRIAEDGDDAHQMDVDDQHEPSTPLFGFDRIEADDQREPSTLASLLDPLDEPSMRLPSSQVSILCTVESATPSLNVKVAYTPPVLEARTPDLNQEFCPPAEPSTPALPEETSPVVEQELPAMTSFQDARLLAAAEMVEKATINDQFPVPTQLVDNFTPMVPSSHLLSIPAQLPTSASSLRFPPLSNAQMEPLSFATMPQQSIMATPQVAAGMLSQHSLSPSLSNAQMEPLNFATMPHQSIMTTPQVAAGMLSQHSPWPPVAQSIPIYRTSQVSLEDTSKQSNSGHFQGFPTPASSQSFLPAGSQNFSSGFLPQAFSMAAPNHFNSVGAQPQLSSNMVESQQYLLAQSMAAMNSASASEELIRMQKQWFSGGVSVQQPSANWPSNCLSTASENPRFTLSPVVQELPLLAQMQQTSHSQVHGLSIPTHQQQARAGIGELANSSALQEFSFAANSLYSVQSALSTGHFTLPVSVQGGNQVQVNRQNGMQAALSTGVSAIPASVQGGNQLQVTFQNGMQSALPTGHFTSVVPVHEGNTLQATYQNGIGGVLDCEKVRSITEPFREEPSFLELREVNLSEKTLIQEVDKDGDHIMQDRDPVEDKGMTTTEKPPFPREETPRIVPKPSPFSNRSLDYLPGDDDVLASILGRGTPTFQVMPTPRENPVPKRPRAAPRNSAKKRKIVFDTSMVLHGDVMRQQLANTDDIRRVRKKAPCTRREIWALQIESQGQQIICEPSFSELPVELHVLYHRVFGANGANLPATDAKGIQQVNGPEIYTNSVGCQQGSSGLRDNGEGHMLESPCRIFEDDRLLLGSQQISSTGDRIALEKATLCTNGGDEEDRGVSKSKPDELEGVMQLKEENAEYSSEFAGLDEQELGILQQELPAIGGAGLSSEIEIAKEEQREEEKQIKEDNEAMPAVDALQEVGQSKRPASDKVVEEGSAEQPVIEPVIERFSGELVNRLAVCNSINNETECKAVELERNTAFLDERLVENSAGEGKDLMEVVQSGEEVKLPEIEKKVEANFSEMNAIDDLMEAEGKVSGLEETLVEKPVSDFEDVKEGERAAENVGDVLENSVDGEINDQEFGFTADGRDTDFLGVDDDAAFDEVEDYDEDAGDELDSVIQDNSGWSSRTRNVGRYLKNVFEGMESSSKRIEDQGPPKLGLERLLTGRTQKEAARMFFETLVLKTKDYIHVEQKNAFDDVHLYPRPKLMKTSF